MTEREGAIISAYTGTLFVSFPVFHKYVEEIMGRPVLTHEFTNKSVMEEIKNRSEEDFFKIHVE